MLGTTDAYPETEATLAMRRRTLTLLLLTLVYFFSYMDRYILAILLELIKKDLTLSDAQLGMLSGLAFAIFYAGLGIPVARLADCTNRRNIIAIALALWSGMTALCGLAQSFLQLLVFRIGVGVGEAGSSPPSHSIIADLYPPEKRASAMAVYATGVVLGGGFGTMIGGTIASYFGWRWAMILVGIPGVVLAIVVRLFVVEPKRGLSDAQIAQDHERMPSAWDAFVGMWRNGPAFHLVIAVTLTSLIGYALTAFGPSYLQRSLGFSIRQVALIVAPIAAIVGAFSGIVGGKLADWVSQRWGIHAQSWMVAILKMLRAAVHLVVLSYRIAHRRHHHLCLPVPVRLQLSRADVRAYPGACALEGARDVGRGHAARHQPDRSRPGPLAHRCHQRCATPLARRGIAALGDGYHGGRHALGDLSLLARWRPAQAARALKASSARSSNKPNSTVDAYIAIARSRGMVPAHLRMSNAAFCSAINACAAISASTARHDPSAMPSIIVPA